MFSFDSKRYPTAPGCYLMRDGKGKVIYVGKAKNLRRRLASYFQPHSQRWRLVRLVARIADIQVILVNNEIEALVLENNLIKQYKPAYNRMLVDDRTGYAYIVLTDEEWPRLLPFKKYRMNKELERVEGVGVRRRFGPYPSTRYRDELLAFVVENHQIRTCAVLPRKACLLYHLHRCSAPCEALVTRDEYTSAVARATAFLSQSQAELIERMKSQVAERADRLEFERAAHIKTQVEALENMLDRQVAERDIERDQDVIYFGAERALVVHIKQGVLMGLALVDAGPDGNADNWQADFLLARYSHDSPEDLIVNRLSGREIIQAALAEANRRAVCIIVPEDGEEYELVKLAELNYAYQSKLATGG